MAEVAVCALSELPPGSVTAAEIEGQRVCVANVHGDVYAVQDKCPHLFAPLSVGALKGSHIVCPWHELRDSTCDRKGPDEEVAADVGCGTRFTS